MNEYHKPRLIIVAGPNGAGKTSITEQLLKHEWMTGCVYVNPDLIARDQFGDWNSPSLVLKAAQQAAEIREECLCQSKSLAFETVLSAPDKVEILAWLTHQRRVDTMRTWVGQSIQRTSESSKGSSPPMKIALSICYRVSGRTDLFVRNVRASPSLAFPLGTSSDVGPVGSSSIRWPGQSCIVRTSRFKNGFGRRTWLLRTRLE